MNKLMFNAWVKAQIVKEKLSFKRFIEEEKGGPSDLIIPIIIIIILIALAIIFRDQLANMLGNLFDTANKSVEDIGNIT